jgi:hypothetical protein
MGVGSKRKRIFPVSVWARIGYSTMHNWVTRCKRSQPPHLVVQGPNHGFDTPKCSMPHLRNIRIYVILAFAVTYALHSRLNP